MKVSKAYIIVIDNPKSIEYAAYAVESCKEVGLDYEVIKGIQNLTADEAFKAVSDKLVVLQKKGMEDKAACATATHFLLWNKIAVNKECAVILEHDAIMLHKPDFEVQDNAIVALGYKMHQPELYDHKTAGPTKRLLEIGQHAGAHAYAITYITAEILLKELFERLGVPQAIDNTYFMRVFPEPEMRTLVPLYLADPICALGWTRESTIWEKPDSFNLTYLLSFLTNVKSKDEEV